MTDAIQGDAGREDWRARAETAERERDYLRQIVAPLAAYEYRQEVERLRAALEEIDREGREDPYADPYYEPGMGCNYDDAFRDGCDRGAFLAGEIARRALAGAGPVRVIREKGVE